MGHERFCAMGGCFRGSGGILVGAVRDSYLRFCLEWLRIGDTGTKNTYAKYEYVEGRGWDERRGRAGGS